MCTGHYACVFLVSLLVLSGLVTAEPVSKVSDVKDKSLPTIQPLFDHPVRDTSICICPDGTYF